MTSSATNITTDTATICIFDVSAMTHRKEDDGDWWSIPSSELAEIRIGNALFLNVGSDGVYQIETTALRDLTMTGWCLNTPCEMVFIGPGEEMSGGGFEPTGEWGGFFVEVEGDHQKVSVGRTANVLTVNFQPTGQFQNELTDLIRL